jgi:V-type H+-transporting ATPase subunit a
MMDIFIHQMIETIEFVLGTVSNTASYLRLWALSLAHSQLAKVFFENTIKGGLQTGSFFSLFIGYFIFIVFTIGVLMLMDLMEAFLHTLRLHWVEF